MSLNPLCFLLFFIIHLIQQINGYPLDDTNLQKRKSNSYSDLSKRDSSTCPNPFIIINLSPNTCTGVIPVLIQGANQSPDPSIVYKGPQNVSVTLTTSSLQCNSIAVFKDITGPMIFPSENLLVDASSSPKILTVSYDVVDECSTPHTCELLVDPTYASSFQVINSTTLGVYKTSNNFKAQMRILCESDLVQKVSQFYVTVNPPSTNSSGSTSTVNSAAIVGGVMGVGACFMAGGLFFFYRRKKIEMSHMEASRIIHDPIQE